MSIFYQYSYSFSLKTDKQNNILPEPSLSRSNQRIRECSAGTRHEVFSAIMCHLFVYLKQFHPLKRSDWREIKNNIKLIKLPEKALTMTLNSDPKNQTDDSHHQEWRWHPAGGAWESPKNYGISSPDYSYQLSWRKWLSWRVESIALSPNWGHSLPQTLSPPSTSKSLEISQHRHSNTNQKHQRFLYLSDINTKLPSTGPDHLSIH